MVKSSWTTNSHGRFWSARSCGQLTAGVLQWTLHPGVLVRAVGRPALRAPAGPGCHAGAPSALLQCCVIALSLLNIHSEKFSFASQSWTSRAHFGGNTDVAICVPA